MPKKIKGIPKSLNFVRNKLGFTIFELLVVFSLVSVVSGIGFVSLGSYSRKQVILQSLANIKQIVDTARFNALSNVKPTTCGTGEELSSYTVKFCFNSNCTGIVGATNNSSYVLQAACGAQTSIVSVHDLPSGVLFTDLPAGLGGICQDFIFKSVKSNVIGGPCYINLTGFSNTITLSINSLGYVSY